MIEENMGSFGHTRSTKGHKGSFGCIGPQRDEKHTKDVAVHDGDL
jgi:hypothetical protein